MAIIEIFYPNFGVFLKEKEKEEGNISTDYIYIFEKRSAKC